MSSLVRLKALYPQSKREVLLDRLRLCPWEFRRKWFSRSLLRKQERLRRGRMWSYRNLQAYRRVCQQRWSEPMYRRVLGWSPRRQHQ